MYRIELENLRLRQGYALADPSDLVKGFQLC